MKKQITATFIVGVAVALTVAAGGQLTGGGGLTRVIHSGGMLSGSGTTATPLAATLTLGSGGILSGSGTTANPLDATVKVGTGITGTGSAGSPLTVPPNAASAGMYGTAVDGDGVMNGTNSVSCATRSGSTYTATSECNFNSLSIGTGVTLKTDGYPLYVRTSMINNGTITVAGTNGSGITAGVGGGSTSRPLPKGASGGNGNSGGGVAAGGNSTLAPNVAISGSAAGGAAAAFGSVAPPNPGTAGALFQGAGGGAGGNKPGVGSGDSGGAGGSVTADTGANGSINSLRIATSSRNLPNSQMSIGSGGGGGGQGNSTPAGFGGGGGGSGGWLVVYALNISGSGTYDARGGNGGDGASGGGGGGGGGSGGVVEIVTGGTPPALVTQVLISGGTGGNGAAGAGGGAAGGAGGTGGTGYAAIFN